MLLTAADIKRLVKAGVTAEAMVVVAEILARNTSIETPHVTPVKRGVKQTQGVSSTERVRKYREKQKLSSVSETVSLSVSSVSETLVSPTPPSLQVVEGSEISINKEVLKKEERKKPVVIARGHRLPEDFVPDASCEKVAREMHYSKAQWNAAIDNFFDYWRGVPGARGLKLDWQATFRNSLRNIRNATRNGIGNGNGTQHTIRSSLEQAFDHIDRREEGLDPGGEESSHDDLLLLPGLRQGAA